MENSLNRLPMNMLTHSLAAAICFATATSGWAHAPAKKPVRIVPGFYVVVNCTKTAAKHYGPEGRNVVIKIERNEAVFHELKEAANKKTPRFKLENGLLQHRFGFYGTSGNLSIAAVTTGPKGSVIKCHAAYIGEFELRQLKSPK